MKLMKAPPVLCVDCSIYLSIVFVPGRVPSERGILKAVHPFNGCAASGEIAEVECRVIDTRAGTPIIHTAEFFRAS
jgi:hypothetical protein